MIEAAPLGSRDVSAALDVLLNDRSPNQRLRQFKSLNTLRYRSCF